MILDSLSEFRKYSNLHSGFIDAAEFLRSQDLGSMPDGRHEIIGEKLFASVSVSPGKGIENAKLEIHKKYIDIQIAVSGIDNIGWKQLKNCCKPDGNYNEEKDIQFFSDLPETWFGLRPDTFAIFFPSDAHAPLAVTGMLHKVVLKVVVDW